jgi:ornithine cyclodeaminase/alanine dehydrogenase-like protein (mu-crystallin family)
MTEPYTLYLSADDLNQALPMSAAIEAMRDAFAQLTRGEVTLPIRECLTVPDQSGVDLIMPCYSAAANVFSLKTVTVFPGNTQRGLPAIQALVILTDAATGAHLAIMDGSRLTALRTGAVSGLATQLLARPNAVTVALFGAGVQARTQLEAVCCVRDVRQASVYDPNPRAARHFATDMANRLHVPVVVADSPATNVATADIICTATSSTEPVVPDGALAAGVHINAIGAFRPDTAEIASDTVCRARVIVDHFDSALAEAGDLLQPLRAGLIAESHFRDELGAVIAGRVPGRHTADEITLFKSVGVAVQDLCAAVCALQNARKMGLGVKLC